VERSESAAGFGKVRSGRLQRNLSMLESGRDGIMRQSKQLAAFLAGEFLGGS
jgi:hypothetical protein